MQCIVLLYHYTGASKIPWMYKLVRLLVASYLFMTGYEHIIYFLRSGKFSLKRAASVLLRINLLSCVLPYVMRTNYMVYYFALLMSFWFLVVYLTLGIGHQGNSNPIFQLLRLMMSAALTTAFIKIPGLLESFFRLLNVFFGISWSAEEWRFRVSLDWDIVYVGMLCAVVHFHYQQHAIYSPTASKTSISFKPVIRRAATILSIVALPVFFFCI